MEQRRKTRHFQHIFNTGEKSKRNFKEKNEAKNNRRNIRG